MHQRAQRRRSRNRLRVLTARDRRRVNSCQHSRCNGFRVALDAANLPAKKIACAPSIRAHGWETQNLSGQRHASAAGMHPATPARRCMCCDESARSAGSAHFRAPESAAARAPVRQTSDDSENRRGCSYRRAGSPCAVAPRPTGFFRCADRAGPPASWARSAACRARARPALRWPATFEIPAPVRPLEQGMQALQLLPLFAFRGSAASSAS
jgi:hypothetical protein